MYSDVLEFRTAMHLQSGGVVSADDLELHNALVLEEMVELVEADTLVDQLDAIIDILYVQVGKLIHYSVKNIEHDSLIALMVSAGNALNMPMQAAWDAVHESNMTKLVKSEQDYHDTVVAYKLQGTTVSDMPESFPSPVYSAGGTHPKGKLLKAASYRPVDLLKVIDGER